MSPFIGACSKVHFNMTFFIDEISKRFLISAFQQNNNFDWSIIFLDEVFFSEQFPVFLLAEADAVWMRIL